MTAGFKGSLCRLEPSAALLLPQGPPGAFLRPDPLAGPPWEETRPPACGLASTAGPEHTLPPLYASPWLAGGQTHPRYDIFFKSYHLCIGFGSFRLLMYLISPLY